jgi:hypothetical protein
MHLLQQFRLGYSESSSWPYVTLPNFDIRATEAEELTGIGLIVYAPLVTTESLQAWEAYSVANQGWIQDDWNYRDASVDVGNISPTVYYQNASSIPATVERHLPVWQTGPVPLDASVVNMDLYQQPVFERLALDVMDVKHTMISDVVNMDFLLERILQNYTHDGEPRSVVFEPVADDFHADSNVMSLILAELAWSVLLKDVLPTGMCKNIKKTLYEDMCRSLTQSSLFFRRLRCQWNSHRSPRLVWICFHIRDPRPSSKVSRNWLSA